MPGGSWDHRDTEPWLEMPFEAQRDEEPRRAPSFHAPTFPGCSAPMGWLLEGNGAWE